MAQNSFIDFFHERGFFYFYFFATKFSNSYHNERIASISQNALFFYLSVFLLTSFDCQLHLKNSLKVGKCF